MKKCFKLIPVFAAGLMLAACSDSTNRVDDGQIIIRPARQADYTIYSGNFTHESSLTGKQALRRAPGDPFAYYKVQDGNIPADYRQSIPAAITQEERTYVLNYIKEHPNEGGLSFDCENYFIQNIGSSYAYYTGNTLRDHNGAEHGVTGGNQMDYLVINGQHINDYNAAWGPDALCLNLPLLNPTYHDSWGDTDNTKANAWKLYSIEGYGYYLCFDYRTKKNSGEYYDGDGVYNDWVIKLIPADGSISVTPEKPQPIVLTPSTGEVEVNLSLNAEKTEDDYIASKLSIHVRDTMDVEVFLPVDLQYYCNADDMNIVLSNPLGELQYNTFVGTVSMTVGGQVVTMNVSFEPEGIRVSTRGINAEVLQYCRNNYQDGITFEVWNYYRDSTRTALQEMLNRSTVSFTAVPGRYVNAFGTVDDAVNPLDCTVLPVGNYTLSDQTEGFNRIYTAE